MTRPVKAIAKGTIFFDFYDNCVLRTTTESNPARLRRINIHFLPSHISHADKRDIHGFDSDIADSVSQNVIPVIRLFDILLRIQTGQIDDHNTRDTDSGR